MIIRACRVCGSTNLSEILSLGELGFTGVFSDGPNAPVPKGVLTLLLCHKCTLVQLDRNFPGNLMYGDNYGYRSGLNSSMVAHLSTIRDSALLWSKQAPKVVVDIGSNDGTLLRHWGELPEMKIGIDPTALKFREYYDETSQVVTDFFSEEALLEASGGRKADVVTSIAMFYDLEDPVGFARSIGECLSDDGVWISEQSYMPWMVESGAYDTICHEHVEYYSLTSLQWIIQAAGLAIVHAELNDANGGSIRLIVKKSSVVEGESEQLAAIRSREATLNLSDTSYFSEFSKFTLGHGEMLANSIRRLNKEGNKVIALGASTKGSVVLQRSGLTRADIPVIGDVNPYKFGKYCANSDIPIVSESEALAHNPDFALVLPWHFRSTFEAKLSGGPVAIWPLPRA